MRHKGSLLGDNAPSAATEPARADEFPYRELLDLGRESPDRLAEFALQTFSGVLRRRAFIELQYRLEYAVDDSSDDATRRAHQAEVVLATIVALDPRRHDSMRAEQGNIGRSRVSAASQAMALIFRHVLKPIERRTVRETRYCRERYNTGLARLTLAAVWQALAGGAFADQGRGLGPWCHVIMRNRLRDLRKAERRAAGDRLQQEASPGEVRAGGPALVVDAPAWAAMARGRKAFGLAKRSSASTISLEELAVQVFRRTPGAALTVADLDEMSAWPVRRRVLLCCLSGLWHAVPAPLWRSWTSEADIAGTFPSRQATHDAGKDFRAALYVALGCPRGGDGELDPSRRNALDQEWSRERRRLLALPSIRRAVEDVLAGIDRSAPSLAEPPRRGKSDRNASLKKRRAKA